ncbi:MAG: hypothetical protein ACI93S_000921 [Ancylomarina sp.]
MENTYHMKYIFSLFTIVFAFFLSSLHAQEFERDQNEDSLELEVQDPIRVKKIEFYKGDVEFIDRLTQDSSGVGSVKITQDYRINDLLKIDRAENSYFPGFQGYRIQIFSGGGRAREKASSIREDLQELFPNERVYVKYKAPDFRVRIGNFRNKFEAMHLYKQCVKIYPYCYLVKDQINLVDLEVEGEIEIEKK